MFKELKDDVSEVFEIDVLIVALGNR